MENNTQFKMVKFYAYLAAISFVGIFLPFTKETIFSGLWFITLIGVFYLLFYCFYF